MTKLSLVSVSRNSQMAKLRQEKNKNQIMCEKLKLFCAEMSCGFSAAVVNLY